jgi:hypothetical protein
LLIPLYLIADVSRLKEKVLRDLIEFRDKYLRSSRDIEEGGNGSRRGRVSNSIVTPSSDNHHDFNAAKYLFPSWRLACLFPELPESALILKFSSPWPKRRFGETGGAVSTEYEQAVILTALSRILLYFLGSLLHFHTLVQDILLQTVCNSGLGLLVVWMIQLFAIHPALPAAVGLSFLLLFGWLSKIFSRKNNEMRERLAAILSLVTTSEEQEQEPSPPASASQDSPPLAPTPRHAELGASSSNDSSEDEDSFSDSGSSGSSGSLSIHIVEVGGDSPHIYRIARGSSEMLPSSDNLSLPMAELCSSLSDSLSE